MDGLSMVLYLNLIMLGQRQLVYKKTCVYLNIGGTCMYFNIREYDPLSKTKTTPQSSFFMSVI